MVLKPGVPMSPGASVPKALLSTPERIEEAGSFQAGLVATTVETDNWPPLQSSPLVQVALEVPALRVWATRSSPPASTTRWRHPELLVAMSPTVNPPCISRDPPLVTVAMVVSLVIGPADPRKTLDCITAVPEFTVTELVRPAVLAYQEFPSLKVPVAVKVPDPPTFTPNDCWGKFFCMTLPTIVSEPWVTFQNPPSNPVLEMVTDALPVITLVERLRTPLLDLPTHPKSHVPPFRVIWELLACPVPNTVKVVVELPDWVSVTNAPGPICRAEKSLRPAAKPTLLPAPPLVHVLEITRRPDPWKPVTNWLVTPLVCPLTPLMLSDPDPVRSRRPLTTALVSTLPVPTVAYPAGELLEYP